jgi:hypothetical protein
MDQRWQGVSPMAEHDEKLRSFENAVSMCAVREAIYRDSNKEVRYYKNHPDKLEYRVPVEDQKAFDWRIYDPRDDDDCSLFMFND